MTSRLVCSLTLLLLASPFTSTGEEPAKFTPLFPENGVPKGWLVQRWDDVQQSAPADVVWKVKDGVLHGSEPRGTWLVSEREYGDFILEFEWKLGERGNSGCGIRFPLKGDPAFDGLEIQMVDPRYYPADMKVPANELTGGLYRVIAPSEQVYRPTDWNQYRITCRGDAVTVVLNGRAIIDTDLSKHHETVQRHNGEPAAPLADRPRKGRIGFQELSRGGGHTEIRNARIQVLE